MPLRDHFRSPVDDVMSWEGLHGGWPMAIVQSLARKLPPEYVAAPRVHHGAFVEIDVATYEKDEPEAPWSEGDNGNGGGVATAVWAPARPTRAVETDLPDTDEYEVRVYDSKRGRRQGQRISNHLADKDFRQEVGAVAAAKHLAPDAVLGRMTLE